ncbi:hypothetical protein [Streptomyces sp. NPDC101776]|uniref:hypothetical protein n=1 Tax=Streptomyces sp. NPDC101776 TaxID=3366146 RepID=UPI0037FD2918
MGLVIAELGTITFEVLLAGGPARNGHLTGAPHRKRPVLKTALMEHRNLVPLRWLETETETGRAE